VEIQHVRSNDICLLIDLQPSGWNDILPIFEFYTKSSFCFPLKATIGNKIVGIGTAVVHDTIGWLAHIIVHPFHRNKGIGQFITRSLVDLLHAKRCETIYLIATDLGAHVYEKVGFETETEYLIFKDLKKDNHWTTSRNIKLYTDNLKEQVAHLDQMVSGENRLVHLADYLQGAYVYKKDDIVEGFYLPAFGEGLIIANSRSAGLGLMKLRLAVKEDAAFPEDNIIAADFMHNQKNTFVKVRRMRLGKKRKVLFSNIYNRIGGNIG